MPKKTNPHHMVLIPENRKEGMRLGRHIHFDDRSKKYRAVKKAAPAPVTTVWNRTVKPFNQGQTGSCTGNGAAGCAATHPDRAPGFRFNEALARKVYSLATQIDNIQGQYPPDDTGSTVLAAMKAGVQLGLFSGYTWCFGISDITTALQTFGPVEFGFNWYDSFDQPDPNGLVSLPKTAKIRGGHAFEAVGVHYDTSKGAPGSNLIECVNSWGSGWAKNGRFYLPFDVVATLMAQSGEAALPKPETTAKVAA